MFSEFENLKLPNLKGWSGRALAYLTGRGTVTVSTFKSSSSYVFPLIRQAITLLNHVNDAHISVFWVSAAVNHDESEPTLSSQPTLSSRAGSRRNNHDARNQDAAIYHGSVTTRKRPI